MGLFSGSFGTGLASGLAAGIDKSMQNALDAREKDMSRARTFWEGRQASKLDLAEAKDERARKSYDRLVTEFGGSTVKALAAYKAMGGSPDEAEKYLAALDDTRIDDIDYSIEDMFKFDKIKLEDYADFTREKAYADIKTPVPAPDVVWTEGPSILTALGMGKDSVKTSATMAEQVESLLPSSERVDSGIMAAETPVNIYKGMKEKTIENTFQAQIVRLNAELAELEKGTDEYTDKLAEYNSVIQAANDYTVATTNPPRGSATVNNLLNGYKSQIESVESTMGFDQMGGTYIATIGGELVTGPAALEERNKKVAATTRSYIRTNILDAETGDIIGGVGGEQDTMSKQQGETFLALLKEEQKSIRGEPAEGDKIGNPPGVLTKDEQAAADKAAADKAAADKAESDKAAEDARIAAEQAAEDARIAAGAMTTEEKQKAIDDLILKSPQEYLQGYIQQKERVLTDKEETNLTKTMRRLYKEANPNASQFEVARHLEDVFKTYKNSDAYLTTLQKEYDNLTPIEKVNKYEFYQNRGVDTGYLGLSMEEAAAKRKKDADKE